MYTRNKESRFQQHFLPSIPNCTRTNQESKNRNADTHPNDPPDRVDLARSTFRLFGGLLLSFHLHDVLLLVDLVDIIVRLLLPAFVLNRSE